MSTAISEISSFDSVLQSPDFEIDAEIFAMRWNAGLDMMGWKPVVSRPPPDSSTDNPAARRSAGDWHLVRDMRRCHRRDELEDGGIEVVLCPFDG